jgi:hypothetical protein
MGLLSRFRPVTVVKRAGRPDEERLTIEGEVQPDMGFLSAGWPGRVAVGAGYPVALGVE